MRIGYALDTHAPPSRAQEVAWPRLREQVVLAEAVGFDLVLVPDHLLYRAGGDNDYAREHEPVGAWESVVLATAIAGATARLTVGHSMMNAPYRSAFLTAKVAATLDEVTGGRYQLGIGSGNSADYDALDLDASDRQERFAAHVAAVSGLLHEGRTPAQGHDGLAPDAHMVLPTPGGFGPPLVVAAQGRRALRVAAEHGDAWNTFASADPAHARLSDVLTRLEEACADVGRDPRGLGRTIDCYADPLDLDGMRGRCRDSILALAELGVAEVRCYLSSDGTHASRMAAIESMAGVVEEAHAT